MAFLGIDWLVEESQSPDLAATASPRERPADQSDGVVNEIPSVKQRWTFADHLVGRWKHVARSLDIEERAIKQVAVDFKENGSREQAYQMLLAWKASIGVLYKALRDERLTSVAGEVFDLSQKTQ